MKAKTQLVTLSTIAAVSGLLVSAGCKREGSTTADADTATSQSYVQSGTNKTATLRDRTAAMRAGESNRADNTRINVRDRDDSTLTAGDQGASEADRDITQQIRKGLTSNDKMSTTAKNIKIITRDCKVTCAASWHPKRKKQPLRPWRKAWPAKATSPTSWK